MKSGTEDGAMPAKVFENIRRMVMAGFAKLVEEVKKYAAPISTHRRGGGPDAPDRTSAKMTSISPSVAMTRTGSARARPGAWPRW